MANENKEKSFYQLGFYLGADCGTEFCETNYVYLRSKTIDNLAKKLNYIKNFRKNVFCADIYKDEGDEFTQLLGNATFEQLENWFKENGIEL